MIACFHCSCDGGPGAAAGGGAAWGGPAEGTGDGGTMRSMLGGVMARLSA